MKDCIFCKIAKKEVSAKIVYEDKEILGFENIQPEAPIHLLFIPQEHIEWSDDLREKDLLFLAKLILAAKKMAIERKIFEACKFIFNVGKTGHIAHIHLHLIGGWSGGEVPMRNI